MHIWVTEASLDDTRSRQPQGVLLNYRAAILRVIAVKGSGWSTQSNLWSFVFQASAWTGAVCVIKKECLKVRRKKQSARTVRALGFILTSLERSCDIWGLVSGHSGNVLRWPRACGYTRARLMPSHSKSSNPITIRRVCYLVRSLSPRRKADTKSILVPPKGKEGGRSRLLNQHKLAISNESLMIAHLQSIWSAYRQYPAFVHRLVIAFIYMFAAKSRRRSIPQFEFTSINCCE